MEFWKKVKDPAVKKEYGKRIAIFLGIAFVLLLLLFVYQGKENAHSPKKDSSSTFEQERLVTSILSGNTTENNFALLEQETIGTIKKEVATLKRQVQQLLVQNKQQKSKIASLKEEASKVIDMQSDKILYLKGQLQQRSTSKGALGKDVKRSRAVAAEKMTEGQKGGSSLAAPFTIGGLKGRTNPDVARQSLSKSNLVPTSPQGEGDTRMVQLSLTNSLKSGKDIDSYIPAGSYASAIIISGVDTKVGVKSSADPKPVLLRITGKAHTAARAGKIPSTIDVRGCLITGQATGSLSSEKVYIRTLQLSCSFAKGKVSEYKMVGYVAGTGKTGVRGRVVSREGDLVEKSFLAGLAGGLGEGASTAFAPVKSLKVAGGTSVVMDGRTRKQKLTDAFGMGIGKGFKNAADRISQYFIDRAEMYQPVITLQAGTKVEVVFLQGVNLKTKGGVNAEGK